jgi:hypothetical protein
MPFKARVITLLKASPLTPYNIRITISLAIIS